MEIEIKTALIGVGATIAGTILGWMLNVISNFGKLNIYISSWKDEFTKHDIGKDVPAKNKDEVEHYGYKCMLDIYNSSAETKIMRNTRVVFLNGKTELKKFIPLDDSTRIKNNMCYAVSYDNLGVLNIPAKSVVSISFHNWIWYNDTKGATLDFLWNAKSIYIKYEDEKNKTKKVKVKDINFNDLFNEVQTTEETNNGQT